MKEQPSVICIGSALWDTIARAQAPMFPGSDVPGIIKRQMGGVALNVALALADRGVRTAVLSGVGQDSDGDALIKAANAQDVDCSHVTRGAFATDNYMALEGPDGEVFGAVADCHSLERLGAEILTPLQDGRISSDATPFTGTIIVDGNLSEATLTAFANSTIADKAFLIFVPASPGKANRLRNALKSCNGTLFANKIEAEILCDCPFANSTEAARAIHDLGANAIITDSQHPASWFDGKSLVCATPPVVNVTSVTGAGDAFLAGFVAANTPDCENEACLQAAITAAAKHISRDVTK